MALSPSQALLQRFGQRQWAAIPAQQTFVNPFMFTVVIAKHFANPI